MNQTASDSHFHLTILNQALLISLHEKSYNAFACGFSVGVAGLLEVILVGGGNIKASLRNEFFHSINLP